MLLVLISGFLVLKIYCDSLRIWTLSFLLTWPRLFSLIVSILSFLREIEIHLYYESAALILVFISLGKYLEAVTKRKTSEVVKKLIGLQPKEATIIKNNKEIKIPIFEVKVGDIVLVKPDEKNSVDDLVIDGYSVVDEKRLPEKAFRLKRKKMMKSLAELLTKPVC